MSDHYRERSNQITFYVTEHEAEMIQLKMKQLGTSNRNAYLRKMAIDGFILKLEVPELKEIVSLMRYSSNNLNQIAKRLNETGRIYETDIADIRNCQGQLWEMLHKLMLKIGEA